MSNSYFICVLKKLYKQLQSPNSIDQKLCQIKYYYTLTVFNLITMSWNILVQLYNFVMTKLSAYFTIFSHSGTKQTNLQNSNTKLYNAT